MFFLYIKSSYVLLFVVFLMEKGNKELLKEKNSTCISQSLKDFYFNLLFQKLIIIMTIWWFYTRVFKWNVLKMVCLRAVLKNRKLGAKETEELKQKTKKTKRICSLGSSMKQTRITAH